MSLHLGTRKVFEESQSQAERTDFPQLWQKCPKGNREHKGLHSRLAGLLWDSEHENNNARMGPVEETQNESKEPDSAGYVGMASL